MLRERMFTGTSLAVGETFNSTIVLWRVYGPSAGRTDAAHLSTRRYSRIVHRWIVELGVDPSTYGAHSIRRTKASPHLQTNENLRAVQSLLGHTKLESTLRYFGIEVDDASEIAEQTEVRMNFAGKRSLVAYRARSGRLRLWCRCSHRRGPGFIRRRSSF
jgi:integrase